MSTFNMTLSQVSRSYLLYHPLKQHFSPLNKILSKRHCFWGWSSSLHYAATKGHFLQVSSSPKAEMDKQQYIHSTLLFINTPTYLNISVGSCPISFVQWRNFSNVPPGKTDKSANKSIEEPAEAGKGGTELTQDGSVTDKNVDGSDPTQKLTLYQRFKKTYKEHGKILVAVHLVTSAVWFGSFYATAKCGFDIVALMEKWNFSETIIAKFRSGSVGDIAVAYLMYKLATPARYTVTLAGTNLAIRYLRKGGKIPQVAQEDTIRSMYREGRDDLKQRSRVHWRKLEKKHRNRSRNVHTKDKH
uniref:DUF1279 domain-containing protein n=1 Tax=Arion vulgaris TaxID=1028688 RepID=A0A0B7AJ99_9EUPU